MAEPLNLPIPISRIFLLPSGADTPAAAYVPVRTATPIPNNKPFCGDQAKWIAIMADLDYRQSGEDYLYALAYEIHLIRVDFTEPQVNIVALPRALLVNIPEDHMLVPGPLLLNQAYFYGARGMGHHPGSGYGAGSLAETIQYNFGITADNYLVVNFQSDIMFINAIVASI